jgi:homospermidine synthase
VAYTGRIVILGFGSIGSGLIPLLLKHFDSTKIIVVGGDNRNVNIAAKYNIAHVIYPITQDNLQQVLDSQTKSGDLLVNLSVNVSSKTLVEYCRDNNILYIDTCIEPWEGFYTDTSLPPERRSNYALRQEMLDLRETWKQTATSNTPTAILAHGANPGLVNHFVKRALLDVAAKHNLKMHDTIDWPTFAQKLGLKVIHIAERDTQIPVRPKKVGEFVNTWSVDGFISEGLQPSEMGWGTHEKTIPVDSNEFSWGCKSARWINQPGCVTRVRSWTPLEGAYHGWIITHNESISIADYFSKDGYRPTVHYAYHPCDAAVLSLHEMAGKNFQEQSEKRLIVDEVIGGIDELGVLLMGELDGNSYCYWYGSQLDIDTARKLAPHNNATSLQVVAPVLAGILYAIRNPNQGIMEADELPYEEIMAITDPYMGKMVGVWTDWTPLQGRGILFPEDVDTRDPWQFKNFRVS